MIKQYEGNGQWLVCFSSTGKTLSMAESELNEVSEVEKEQSILEYEIICHQYTEMVESLNGLVRHLKEENKDLKEQIALSDAE